MRRRLLGKLAERVTLSYGKPVITYLAYGTVPVGGVTADETFLPSYRYYVPVTETVTKGTSSTSKTNNVEVTQDTDLSTLSFTPSLFFSITSDGRSDVKIVEGTGSLIVGSAEKIVGEGFYGVGTVHMTVTVEGTTSDAYDCYVEQAMNTVQVTTSYSIDITRFDYDAAPADKDTDNLYPNLDFTVTETKTYSDDSPDETIVDNVSYRNGTRNSGSEWSPRFTKVSGDFGVIENDGRVYGIRETEEAGDGVIELGEVRVDIDIPSYTSASATTKVYQEMNEEPQEDTSFPMDILMLNNETHKQEIMGRDEHTTKDFPTDGTYTPIGIVLTPVYDDSTRYKDDLVGENWYSGYGGDVGVMGVIALTDASLASPEDGTTNPSEILCGSSDAYNERMYVAEEEKNNRRINLPSCLPRIDDNGKPTEDVTGWAEDVDGAPNYDKNIASAATDKSDTVASPLDVWSGYASESGNKAPSPYFVSENYKEECIEHGDTGDFECYNYKVYEAYEDSESYGNMNALADYNGELNSLEILLGKSFGIGREWIENTTSNSNTQRTDCPAVEACWKYAPEGTAQGGWYLPALGELSLMAARFKKINETLEQLNSVYGVEVSLLKDTGVPYLSSTHFISQINDETTQREVETRTLFALVPKVGEAEDMGYNRVCTSAIGGVTRYGGYVRPFKKIRNEIPYGNTYNAYNYTPHYELMPAHYTQTFCDGVSGREWFGQKFIVSFRRACMGYMNTAGFQGMDGSLLRIYGYKVKGENDTTKVDETPRLLAEMYVEGAVSGSLTTGSSDHWPQVSDGQGGYKYEGDEMGLNIVGRFSTKYQFNPDGAFDEEKGDYVDMDTDEFDRDGTVEPGWYVLAGIGVTATPRTGSAEEVIISAGSYWTITKKEIDIIDEVESKEAFFDEIRHSTLFNLTERTDAPFYVGQFDRPVAILLGAEGVRESD